MTLIKVLFCRVVVRDRLRRRLRNPTQAATLGAFVGHRESSGKLLQSRKQRHPHPWLRHLSCLLTTSCANRNLLDLGGKLLLRHALTRPRTSWQ